MKHILLLGGTGKTGRLLTKMALDAGLYVTLFVRNPATIKISNDHLEIIEGDILNYMDIEKAVQGQDAVLSTLAKDCKSEETLRLGTKKIIRAMENEKVYRFIALSSIGAGSSKDKMGFLSRWAMRVRGRSNLLEAMAEQENLLYKSHLNYTLIQAGALTSCGWQRVKDLKTFLPAQIKNPLLASAKKAGRGEVAAFMLNELLNPLWIRKTVCVHH